MVLQFYLLILFWLVYRHINYFATKILECKDSDTVEMCVLKQLKVLQNIWLVVLLIICEYYSSHYYLLLEQKIPKKVHS